MEMDTKHATIPSSLESDNENNTSPFRALGIAVVVDQRGKGARLLFRYPTSPLVENTEDLFFRLPSRQMAKLFRPKPALCGQPMTLSVGGTVFCCRAVLMDHEDSPEASNDDTSAAADNKDHLVLFSVVVALSPQFKISAIPISGWFEGTDEQKNEISTMIQSIDGVAEGKIGFEGQLNKRKATESFLAIRRVHISLSRLCQALEREERRCDYISVQAKLFFQIKHDLQVKYHEQKKAASALASTSAATSSIPPKSHGGERRSLHNRSSSFSYNFETTSTEHGGISRGNSVLEETQPIENEQELLDIFMSAPNPTSIETGIEHHGNLAHDLVQVYHAMTRNDHDFLPTPSVLLTGRDGTVYINRHVAVPLEAVAQKNKSWDTSTATAKPIRPYHTLLFPHASPQELLETLSLSVSVTPQRLQQLLLTANPRKTLKEMAIDANVSLNITLEIASYLILQGVCLPAPVISRSSVLACRNIGSLQDIALLFVQTFGLEVNVFVLVGHITNGNRTLDDAIAALRNESTAVLQKQLSKALDSLSYSSTSLEKSENQDLLEDLFFQMAMWLYAHQVLVPLHDFLVALAVSTPEKDESSEKEVETTEKVPDDALYEELMENKCLQGDTTVQACAWKLGIEADKLYSFVARFPKVKIVKRVASTSDVL